MVDVLVAAAEHLAAAEALSFLPQQPGPLDGAMVLAFDTETTGLTGVVCQVGCVAVGEDGCTMLAWQRLLRLPPGWRMEPGAQAVHGITEARLQADGDDATLALRELAQLLDLASRKGVPIVAHNASFDKRALLRTAEAVGAPNPLGTICVECTMQKSRVVAKALHGANRVMRNAQLYATLVAPPPPEAELHDAVADARLTAESFAAGRRQGYW